MLQPFQVILPIRITPKDHLALMPPADYMVKSPKKFQPWFTRHRACLWQYPNNTIESLSIPLEISSR